MSLVRSAALRGFRATVAELGGDALHYAGRAGLPPSALDADDLLVQDEAVGRTLELAARDLECPDLGLRVARRQELSLLGPLALAVQSSATVGDALACVSRYLFVHAEALHVAVRPDPYGDPGVVGLQLEPSPADQHFVQGSDLSLGFLHRSTRALAGQPYGLRTVELPHAAVAPITVYEDFFEAPVRVNRPAALLRVPRSLLTLPRSGADESLRQLALAFLAEQSGESGPQVVPRVRAALQQILGTATPELEAVARLLDMHPRTLQRRLAAEGTTFAEVLDAVRRQTARSYLTGSDLPIAKVAALVGLSEQSALTRCARRWWGTTPSQVRRRTPGGRGTPGRAAPRR